MVETPMFGNIQFKFSFNINIFSTSRGIKILGPSRSHLDIHKRLNQSFVKHPDPFFSKNPFPFGTLR